MEWIKKNWLWLIIVIISALPLAETLAGLSFSLSDGFSYSAHIPDEIKARVLRSGRHFSPWGMPVHLTGEWAIRMMVITLTCTPLSIIFNNARIQRYKKVFGIYTFIYTVLHLTFYLAEHNFLEIFSEMNLILALIATIIIVPLGLTSNKLSMRLMKKNWKKLQEFAYAAAVASVLHLALLGKDSWVLYGVILGIGFIVRTQPVKAFFRSRKNSMAAGQAA